jgi:DNA modification methylase
MAWTIHHGDCREVMATLDAESVDAIVSDPPYGLSFMGKGWDHGVPGVEFWVEAMRVAKPGAHLLAFGGTRTYHRLACAIEDAGWEIRDCVMWVYGSGFPKSLDVSKAIDKAAGEEREVVGQKTGLCLPSSSESHRGFGRGCHTSPETARDITAPATDAARQWSGWGTALKPAWEPIIVARKPLVGTVAENVLRYGTGGINVDGCRVGTEESTIRPCGPDSKHAGQFKGTQGGMRGAVAGSGRWPANLIHDGSEEVVGLFPSNVKGGTWNRTAGARHFNNDGEPTDYQTSGSDSSSGSAARFFYCAKASKADRDEGCEGLEAKTNDWQRPTSGLSQGKNPATGERSGVTMQPRTNHHPTVKPTDLMRYLCRLVTPPGGVVLDPFTGSGSTGKAATLEGFRFIGIEREAEYVEIAKARIAAVADPAPGTLF